MENKWQSIGGATREMFPLANKDWTGPEKVEAILSSDDDLKAIRGVFTRPDGSKRMAEVTYGKTVNKHRFYPV